MANASAELNLTGPTLISDALVIVSWTALGLYGMVTNIIILIGILSAPKMATLTSYWLIVSLSLCDISMLLVCFIHLLPATALRESYVKMDSFSNAFGVFIYDAFWYIGVLHLMVMSLNRYVNICHPKNYVRLFSPNKTIAIMLGAYVFGLAVALPTLYPCCYVIYNYELYAAHYLHASTPYGYVDMAINGLSILIMLFCYTAIIMRVRTSRVLMQRYRKLCRSRDMMLNRQIRKVRRITHARKDSRMIRFISQSAPNILPLSRREIRLFLQFATVSMVFLMSMATWEWLPRMTTSKWVGFVVTSLFFLNNAINPTVYLIFNSSLRIQLQHLFCPMRDTGEPHDSCFDPNFIRTYNLTTIRRRGQHQQRSTNGTMNTNDSSNNSLCNPSVGTLATTGLFLTAYMMESYKQQRKEERSTTATDLTMRSRTISVLTSPGGTSCTIEIETDSVHL